MAVKPSTEHQGKFKELRKINLRHFSSQNFRQSRLIIDGPFCVSLLHVVNEDFSNDSFLCSPFAVGIKIKLSFDMFDSLLGSRKFFFCIT